MIVTGKITTYPGRSQYQIIIETMEPAGVGALLAQLERLKARLAAEGLFEAARKRPLPAMPRGDRGDHQPDRRGDPRHPASHPRPLAMPGDRLAGGGAGRQAAAQVARPSRASAPWRPAGAIPRPDVLIVARGGGSVEDLWPFNDEALARAAAASADPADLRGRPRDRHHPDRLRLRPPGADARPRRPRWRRRC